ncbi:MAG: hypothetical protein WA703_07295, partial [Pseudolabrys sp.]
VPTESVPITAVVARAMMTLANIAVSQLLPDQDHSARARCTELTNAHMRVKCLRAAVCWQIKTPGLVKPGVTVHR